MEKQPNSVQAHSFHIPVMGTGFTIDTALKVARYGISSVMSVDDNLMEMMRGHYSSVYGETCEAIPKAAPDSRAKRITAYLDFVGRVVARQMGLVKGSPFQPGSMIVQYFEMLSDDSILKKKYQRMLLTTDPDEKSALQKELRSEVVAGSIDVNILTKLDRERYENGEKLPREYSDALSALRGFANSSLEASVVFSAGLNLHLFSYAENFDDFYVNDKGLTKKKIILKVSDYRSAFTQGKIFAKKGIWVSEYRIESGLNCGGHAFATDGHLLGPVLEEFKQKRSEFIASLFDIYRGSILEKKKLTISEPPPLRITAQGGIGTSQENQFLMRRYELDGTGWGTPFLLVPDATSVDDVTLSRLLKATNKEVYLSNASPMGVPIYNLRTSMSEETRLERIKVGRPGSPCLNGFMAFNTEFSKVPLCTASHAYQKQKIEQLNQKGLSETEYKNEYEKIVEKACVCHDLGDSALAKHGLSYPHFEPVPAICPGPNIVYFFKISSLKEMVDHIYGRNNVLNPALQRPHFFINELNLYINYLKKFVSDVRVKATPKDAQYILEFKQNLMSGIEYYRGLAGTIREESELARQEFLSSLRDAGVRLCQISLI